jgi:hypothetical protein
VSFNVQATFDDLPDRNQLSLRDNRRAPSPGHDVNNSRRFENLKLPVHSLTDKHITREQGEQDLLGAVLPSAEGAVQRKINHMILVRKRERDAFLMLMARQKGVPIGCTSRTLSFHF